MGPHRPTYMLRMGTTNEQDEVGLLAVCDGEGEGAAGDRLMGSVESRNGERGTGTVGLGAIIGSSHSRVIPSYYDAKPTTPPTSSPTCRKKLNIPNGLVFWYSVDTAHSNDTNDTSLHHPLYSPQLPLPLPMPIPMPIPIPILCLPTYMHSLLTAPVPIPIPDAFFFCSALYG
ncbi:hypothetical protein Hypma_007048 [Hypsizygus marmoreus]|uniref:Uncharacterized protein n=1 Tax=Hypsizygus marmoreus TaxID=39966 RepID=A0A369KAC3_HYPMA|nr:hypothetical protein Hypma_007048 [Hypsizygus marmoreus]